LLLKYVYTEIVGSGEANINKILCNQGVILFFSY